MDSSRRRVLQLLGLSSLALTATPVLNAFAKEAGHAEEPKPVIKENKKALTAKQWAMVIDTRQFESAADLEPLVEVCNTIHNVPHLNNKRHEIKWIWGSPLPQCLSRQGRQVFKRGSGTPAFYCFVQPL